MPKPTAASKQPLVFYVKNDGWLTYVKQLADAANRCEVEDGDEVTLTTSDRQIKGMDAPAAVYQWAEAKTAGTHYNGHVFWFSHGFSDGGLCGVESTNADGKHVYKKFRMSIISDLLVRASPTRVHFFACYQGGHLDTWWKWLTAYPGGASLALISGLKGSAMRMTAGAIASGYFNNTGKWSFEKSKPA
jgi:hypothetical protein